MQEEDKMVVAGKKVLVFGSGISGIGAVKLLEETMERLWRSMTAMTSWTWRRSRAQELKDGSEARIS